MPNYQHGKIYMIESISNNCRYYGSTVQSLALRLAKHRNDIKRGRTPSSKEVLKYSDARILLVELYPCNSKMELEAKEAIYIRNNDCVNKFIPQRTAKEWRQDNKEHIQQYHKQHYQDNKEIIAEKDKIKYQDNKEKIKQRIKRYYQDNKEKMLKKCLCDCGKICSHSSYKKHLQAKQHQFYQKTYDFIIS
jgi:gas vesicle protein